MSKNLHPGPSDHLGPSAPTVTADLNSPTLDKVEEQFIEWRKHRKFGIRIPESLWSQALSLCDTYSVGKITRTLGLSWECFQKRLCKSRGVPYQSKKSKCKLSASKYSPPFIELKVSEPKLGNPSPCLSPSSPCLIELTNPAGGSLRIYASAVSLLDINLNGLVDKFLSS
jgi:hypothetical protein